MIHVLAKVEIKTYNGSHNDAYFTMYNGFESEFVLYATHDIDFILNMYIMKF